MTLNIAWLTSRFDCGWDWFCDSLHNECGGNYDGIRVIAIDYYAQTPIFKGRPWDEEGVATRQKQFKEWCRCPDFVHSAPKPTPWQGPHRLTKNNYFAAANARNTAICLAKDGYIAFVDDISVLLPGWLATVREHMAKEQIVCGAFRKVLNLKVDNGHVVDFADHAGGWDSRWKDGNDSGPVKCHSNWLFGCSFGCPVERLLEVNGMYEACDSTGTGMEDCALGVAFGNIGHQLWYDRRMLTFESEELHHIEAPMLRLDKHRNGSLAQIKPGETDPFDKGHALVNMYRGANRFENYFGAGGLRGLRDRVLLGERFPTNVLPENDWFDGQQLSEL